MADRIVLSLVLVAVGLVAFAVWAMYNEVVQKLDVLHRATRRMAEAQEKFATVMMNAFEDAKEKENG